MHSRPPFLRSPMEPSSTAGVSARLAARSRRGGVQHLDVGVSGNPDRPELLPPDRHPDLSAYRQHRHQPRGHRESRACRRPVWSSATCPSCRPTFRMTQRLDAYLRAEKVVAIAASTPASSPRAARRVRRRAASSLRPRARRSTPRLPWPRRAPFPASRAWTSPRSSVSPSAMNGSRPSGRSGAATATAPTGASTSSPTTSASSTTSCACWSSAAAASRWCRRRRRHPKCWR